MRRLFICGMKSEADLIKGECVVIGAGNQELLQHRLKGLQGERFDLVISFGVCGALSPFLSTGKVIRSTSGYVFAEASTKEQKETLNEEGKTWVDMETAIALDYAKARETPIAVIRAVLDEFDQTLPPAALIPLNQDGTPNACEIAKNVFMNPFQIPALMRLREQQTIALNALRKALPKELRNY